ncbi:MAG: hypothetical protein IJT25_01250 [Clostridia bacterium]|nr:hypothetical protein [Clostridia bacterium]
MKNIGHDLLNSGQFIASNFNLDNTNIGILVNKSNNTTDVYFDFNLVQSFDGVSKGVIKNAFTFALKQYISFFGAPSQEGLKTIKQELANATNSVEISDNFETTYDASYNEDELSL